MLWVGLVAGCCKQCIPSQLVHLWVFVSGVCSGYSHLSGAAVKRGFEILPLVVHVPARRWHLPPTLSLHSSLAVALFTLSAHPPGCLPAKELLDSMLIEATLKISSLEASVIFNKHTWLPPWESAKCTTSVFLVYDLVEKTDKHKHKSPWYETNWKYYKKDTYAEGHMAEGRERFISTQAVISSKDKEIWWILVGLRSLFSSIPKGLGSVNQITTFEAAFTQRTQKGLPDLCCAAFRFPLLPWAPGQAWLGSACPLRVSCVVFPNAWLCVLFVFQSSSALRRCKSALRFNGSPGQRQFQLRKLLRTWDFQKELIVGMGWGYC